MRKIHGLGLVLVATVMLGGCPSPTTEEDAGNGSRLGYPCVIDSECNGLICLGGLCADPGTSSSSSGGSGGASGSMGGSSGGRSSSSGSSGIADGGAPDAAGPGGRIVLDPNGSLGALEFGATRIGASTVKNVLVTNEGTAPAQLISLGFRNNMSGEFTLAVVGGQPAALTPGQQITVRITHAATDATADNAFLSVVTNAQNPLVELPLAAEFKGDPVLLVTDSPTSTVDLTTLQVTPTPVGTPVETHVFIKNIGQADSALSVTSVALNPAVSALFSITSGPMPRSISAFPGPCVDLGGCSAGAAECRSDGLCWTDTMPNPYPLDLIDVTLTFNAGAPGEAMTELVITTDVSGTPVTRRIAVAALAQDTRVTVNPNPIAFGDVFLGRTLSRQVTIENPSDATSVLEITNLGIRYTPAPFNVNLGGVSFPYPLTPGSSVVISIVFAPTNPGTFNNSLAISRMDGLPIYIPITARGVNEPNINVAAALDFGGVIPGTPKTLPLTIGNTADGPLTVSLFEITPANAPFSVLPTMLGPVDGMMSGSVQVTYAPPVAGMSHAATLLLHSNDPDTPLVQVALSGQGVVPAATVTPGSVTFPATLINSAPSPQQTFTVRNDGMGGLTVDSPRQVVTAGNANIPQYTVTASRALPATVASGDAMTFTVTFAPTTTVAYAGNITLTTNDPARPQITVPVTGTGHNCVALPNTTVSVVNGTMCAYMCVANAVQCGDQSCVPCPQRHGANMSCGAGNTCQYSCPANTGEASDPPATCASARDLGQIQDGNGTTTTAFRLYPANDVDWFRFVMKDKTSGFFDEGVPFTTLRANVSLSGVAVGETFTVEIMADTCGGGSPQTVAAGQSVTIESDEYCDRSGLHDNGTPANPDDDYTVPIDDSRTFYIRVAPQGDSYACTSYTLSITVDEDFFAGFCL